MEGRMASISISPEKEVHAEWESVMREGIKDLENKEKDRKIVPLLKNLVNSKKRAK